MKHLSSKRKRKRERERFRNSIVRNHYSLGPLFESITRRHGVFSQRDTRARSPQDACFYMAMSSTLNGIVAAKSPLRSDYGIHRGFRATLFANPLRIQSVSIFSKGKSRDRKTWRIGPWKLIVFPCSESTIDCFPFPFFLLSLFRSLAQVASNSFYKLKNRWPFLALKLALERATCFYLYARIRLATGDHVFNGMISLKIQPRATLGGVGTGKGRVSGERCAVRHSTVSRVGCFFEKN